MRKRTVLLTLVPTLAAAAIAPSVNATVPPGSDYPWAQPGTAAGAAQVQPPATIPIAPEWQTMQRPGSSYAWAQPGTAVVQVPNAQPPAWVPIVP